MDQTLYDLKKRVIFQTLSDTNLINLNFNNVFDSSVDNFFEFSSTLAPSGNPASTLMIFIKSALLVYDTNKMFGVGPKMFRIACAEHLNSIPYGCSTHHHNMYAQLLSATGLILAVPIFGLFLFIIFTLFKQLYYNYLSKEYLREHRIHLYLAVCISLWPLVTSSNIFNNWMSIVYFLPVGFLLALRK